MTKKRNLLSKVITLVVALTMVFAMAIPAFASDVSDAADDATTTPTTYSLTLENTGVTKHTFEVYQIFKGDLSVTEKDGVKTTTLSNITWGDNVSAEGKATLGGGDAAKYAETIKTENVKAVAQTLGDYVTGTPKTVVVAAGQKETVNGLSAGYYFVKDTADSQDNAGDDKVKHGAYTSYILEVVKDTEAQSKLDVPTVEKKVKDINDSTETELSNWQDSADHDVDDVIYYKITGTLPDNYDDYSTYYYQFSDTMSKGLTFNDDTNVKITVGTTDVTSSFVKVVTPNSDGSTTVTWTCSNLKAITSITKDSEIVVNYTCTLNSNAVMGADGNPNTVKLIYSNNPNNGGDGDRGETPEDKNIVFTYKVTVDKYANEAKKGNELNGAGFTLFKVLADGTEKKIGEEIVGTSTYQFAWERVDDGKYILRETTVPAGYNKIDDIEFEITATHDKTADEPKLTELKGTSTSATFTTADDKSKIATDVVNKSGSNLPSTGGIGTTLFYLIGAVLVLSAGIVLITRKRMERQ